MKKDIYFILMLICVNVSINLWHMHLLFIYSMMPTQTFCFIYIFILPFGSLSIVIMISNRQTKVSDLFSDVQFSGFHDYIQYEESLI